ncbi:G-type lectin S-receptor-like serine/threonine-protein kinase LECRK3 [Eucalyptus grandis]|uniref:G-type lectin S-receptor-like serine/threonine-protein kinase LECRK3 n=1 Tax=Eucalyptus grandis TaxID=71139 RepID=UPI00192ECD4A|nr:G-type lectin S-receptor-like serine/threonine-protein kinase LECRK3 [Eucalyptus grandis]
MTDSTLHCMRFTSIVAPLPILLPFAFIFITATSQRQTNISLGASLTPSSNNSWLSPSGLFKFGFYLTDRGYWVGVTLGGTVVWTANRNNPPVPSSSTLLFTNDGRLVLQSTGAQDTLVANASEKAVLASFSDTGNFVLYNSRGDKIWQSFHSPTDTLLAGQILSPGQQLLSSISDSDPSTGIFRLDMQTNGNLVQYPVDSPVGENYYWSSETFGLSNTATLYLDNDGSLYLLNITGEILKNITPSRGPPKEGILYLMRLDVDGILRLYSYNATGKNLSVKWYSSNNKCSPGGVCGFNMFCMMIDQNAECECLPGFVPVNKGDRYGCKRKFTAQTCEETNPLPGYNIEPVNNTVWENTTYDSLTSLTEKECQEACLRDCNCEAVIYEDGNCGKQRLPLRYGRRDPDESNTLYIKVGETRLKRPFERVIPISIASSVAFALVTLAVSGFIVSKYRARVHVPFSKEGNTRIIENVSLKLYTYEELKKVTKDFAEQIGKGAFGTVYKGTLSNDLKVVAVKKLEKIASDGDTEFQTEVKIIGRTHHRNLVKLLGYCVDGQHRLLVYEYMSNGSLADLLFAPERRPRGDEKMGIARNIARGLLYLHEECETQIIHCDIKPQNILIDKHKHAKISDFGLSKLLKPDQTNTMTRIRGTRGYVAPEWHKKLPVTVKADVYSFGIMLLEIICCRRSVDWKLPDEEAVLEEWVHNCFRAGELEKLVDDELMDRRQLERMVKVGLWCVLEEPSLRPSMKKVLLMLEGTVDIPIPPCPSSIISAI